MNRFSLDQTLNRLDYLPASPSCLNSSPYSWKWEIIMVELFWFLAHFGSCKKKKKTWVLIQELEVATTITPLRFCWLVILVLARVVFSSASSPTLTPSITSPPPLVLLFFFLRKMEQGGLGSYYVLKFHQTMRGSFCWQVKCFIESCILGESTYTSFHFSVILLWTFWSFRNFIPICGSVISFYFSISASSCWTLCLSCFYLTYAGGIVCQSHFTNNFSDCKKKSL